MRTRTIAIAAVAALALLGACSDDDAGQGPQPEDEGGWQGWNGGGSGGSSSGGADASASSSSSGAAYDAGKPAEIEKDLDLGAPEASANFVFVPVSGADHVVKVNGKTLSVSLIEVGDRPTVLATVPGEDAALVINAGSDDVTLIRATDTTDAVSHLPILPHCNALSVAPDGKRAIAWYDHMRAAKGDPVGSFQAVSIIELDKGAEQAWDVSVGFRPSAIVYSADGGRAHVVTDDGISVLDFATLKAGAIIAPVAVSPDPLDKGKGREVRVTPDGTWAVVRQADLKGVRAVHLPSKKLTELSLPSIPTDLDLLPDGKAALVVLRETQHVVFVDLPAAATPALSYKVTKTAPISPGLARITSDGALAILYSTVSGTETIGSLDLKTGELTAVAIRKTVDAVFMPPGSHRAVLVHRPADGPSHADPTEAFVDDAHGYTFVDLDTGFTKLEMSKVKATGFALVDSPARLYMLHPDPAGIAHAVHGADLGTLLGSSTPLGSKPLHVRYLSVAKVVAIAQDHTSGRMTFLPVGAGEAKTVTGYELNARVK